ncbi:hypothetical protein HUO13_08280 [Saccharopolyspora erythraea]|uniref:hypothetical protein n=1 Tax=Saccharopolyspora erythraea TaxID=1836 RepID=UPI001BA9DA5A|nr:hypothetical protein [Saccharopolyspora erythraea]QUH00816.1 hypothetical protein HUO13_08280 [Saccharopolyspora erythraea]
MAVLALVKVAAPALSIGHRTTRPPGLPLTYSPVTSESLLWSTPTYDQHSGSVVGFRPGRAQVPSSVYSPTCEITNR